MRSLFVLVATVFLAMGTMCSLTDLLAAENAPGAELTNADCIKCHPGIVHQIQEAGGKHKTEVACLDCHEGGHPPATPKGAIIPKCSKCHEGEPHFQLKGCLKCHRNPHQPLKIVFPSKTIHACQTCHPKEVKDLTQHHTAHAKLDCSYCHNRHGYIPECLKCHKPHRKGQKFKDCLRCHRAHYPLPVTYGKDVPNKDCGACHPDLKKLLESGHTKHAKLQCVFCHKKTHGVRPACTGCHGKPHPAAMMKKFKKCTDCHRDAHNLSK